MDFCKLNAVTKFSAFPIPHIEEILEKGGQEHFISTLDMSKVYWQIPMAAEDQEKMVFGTPWSLFEFCSMLFSLYGMAATFQEVMDHL